MKKLSVEQKIARRRKFKRTLSKLIIKGEKSIHKSKKLVIAVFIPTLEILANLLTIMDEEDQGDNNWYK